MSDDLFRSVHDPHAHPARRSRGTLVVSLVAHVGVLSLLVIVPLVATDTLPSPATTIRIFTPTAEPPPPPPPPPAPSVEATRPSVQTDDVSPIPFDPPDGIRDEIPVTRHVGIDAVIGGVESGVPYGLAGGLPASPRAPDPPPPSTRPLRVSDGIRMPKKVVDVAPVYPAMARTARREGIVLIEAVIDVDGRVRDARVLRSVTLLDDAALAAVRQWRYQPTLLNGVPVPVVVTVTVVFRLQ